MTNTKDTEGQSRLNDGLGIQPLYIEVRGSNGITFEEGAMTGDMVNGGVSIGTVWYAEDRRLFGGCINRKEATQIRDFLNKCIEKWEKEDKNAKD